jgi:hypothetical protein
MKEAAKRIEDTDSLDGNLNWSIIEKKVIK